MTLAIGLAAWLSGQYHFAWRHRYYKSPLAASILTRVPEQIEPTHDWHIVP